MRVTSQHWEVFISICEKHPNLITNKFNGAQGKAEGKALWANVATKLNSLGLGEKSIVEWRRAVTDWKCKVKTKASKLRQSATQTGGGFPNTPPLTPLEEKLIAIMGKKCFEGDKGIRELGIPIRGETEPVEIFQNVVEELEYVELNSQPNEIMAVSENTESSSQPIQIIEEFEYAGPSSHPTQTFSDVNASIQVHTSIPLTPRSTLVDKVLKNKRKHDELSTAEEYRQEHDYCRENKSPTKKGKRTKIECIPRISKNIENMTSKSLDILQNIDKNTSRIADSFEKFVDYYLMQERK